MARVMIVGAGGVGNVVAHKCAAQAEFSDILLASRSVDKCQSIAKRINSPKVQTAALDADVAANTVKLMREFKPDLLINVALPYQDLALMDACLETGVHYLDTANYEPPDVAKFEYSWQWKYHDRFKAAGLTAILGCGFDPGVTGVFSAYALTILMKFMISILSIAMMAVMVKHLPQISTPKLTFVKSLNQVDILKMASG
jgi:saccharopine dehydrogenase (NAD+, L-lysine forming)